MADQGKFADLADWWNLMFKPEVKLFYRIFCYKIKVLKAAQGAVICEMLDRVLWTRSGTTWPWPGAG